MAEFICTVKADFNPLKYGLRGLEIDAALGQVMANEMLKGGNAYIPMRTGALKKSGIATPWKVTWGPLPYARKVWFGNGIRIHQEVNPKASRMWAMVWRGAHPDAMNKTAARYLKKVLR